MEKPGKIQVFAIDILIGLGFGLLICVATIFIRHNPLIAILISIVYALLQIGSFWKLFKTQMYLGMIGRFLISGCFACILGAMIWGIFFLGNSIDRIDELLSMIIIALAFLLSLIHAILKNFFPESRTYKKLEQTFAGLSAFSVLEKE